MDAHRSNFAEDLPRLASEAYRLGTERCSTCRDMHTLWPYIRLTRASAGVETGGSGLELLLRELLAKSRLKVLIAGSADTGLMALVANASSGHGVDITVLDLCDTPLAMCRRLAAEWFLPVETLRRDLIELDLQSRYDVVLVHGTLHYIHNDRKPLAVRQLARSLRPGGRLLIQFNVSPPFSGPSPDGRRDNYADWVVDELKRQDIPLPDDEAEFRARLTAHAGKRKQREGAFTDPNELAGMMDAAGPAVERLTPAEVDVVTPFRQYLSQAAVRRYMSVGRAKD
jgi:SAM-dependent methyltransferase